MENPYIQKQISTSVEIVRSYLFDKPFHVYLKEVFRNHKQWGSKDRRNYKKYCYLILKNAGTLGKYFREEYSNFSEQWKIHFGELPTYFWPICLFNPKSISKLNLVELNYSALKKGLKKDSDKETEVFNKDNAWTEPRISSDVQKIATIQANLIDFNFEELELIESHPIKVSHFNQAIVDWVIELEKDNYIWDAYDAFQFSMNQTKKEPFGFLPSKSKNHENLHSTSISKNIEVSKLNKWFQREAPVFYLDRNTGINQEFAPNSAVNDWVDNGLGIIQDRSSTQSIQYLLDYLSKEIIHVTEDSKKYDVDSKDLESPISSNQDSHNADNNFIEIKQNSHRSKSESLNSSDQTFNIPRKEDKLQSFKVWDCCSGAGGKSISFQIQFEQHFKRVNPLIKQVLFQSNWICSDVRQTIVDNLKKRYKLLGLIQPKAIQLNLLDDSFECSDSNILECNLIIADLPCTGSGTWRRTAEELLKEISVKDFANRQYQIIENVLKIKSSQGNSDTYYIYYMTCSILAMENEQNIELLLENHSELQCIWQNYFGGYSENADFIYGALIKVN